MPASHWRSPTTAGRYPSSSPTSTANWWPTTPSGPRPRRCRPRRARRCHRPANGRACADRERCRLVLFYVLGLEAVVTVEVDDAVEVVERLDHAEVVAQ